jgi:hypothetical protein
VQSITHNADAKLEALINFHFHNDRSTTAMPSTSLLFTSESIDDSEPEVSTELSETSKQIIEDRLDEKQKESLHHELHIDTRRSCDKDEGATKASELPLLIIKYTARRRKIRIFESIELIMECW